MAVAKEFREGRFQELRDHEWFGVKEKVEVDPKAHRLGGGLVWFADYRLTYCTNKHM